MKVFFEMTTHPTYVQLWLFIFISVYLQGRFISILVSYSLPWHCSWFHMMLEFLHHSRTIWNWKIKEGFTVSLLYGSTSYN